MVVSNPNPIFLDRVNAEYDDILQARLPIIPDDPKNWTMKVKGQGKWFGRTYTVKVTLPTDYPYAPPQLEWRSTMTPKHPNISSTGSVCLSILRGRDWTTVMNLSFVYKCLMWLLRNPNYDSSYHPVTFDAINSWTPNVSSITRGIVWPTNVFRRR